MNLLQEERAAKQRELVGATWRDRYPSWIDRLMRRLTRLLIGRDWRIG